MIIKKNLLLIFWLMFITTRSPDQGSQVYDIPRQNEKGSQVYDIPRQNEKGSQVSPITSQIDETLGIYLEKGLPMVWIHPAFSELASWLERSNGFLNALQDAPLGDQPAETICFNFYPLTAEFFNIFGIKDPVNAEGAQPIEYMGYMEYGNKKCIEQFENVAQKLADESTLDGCLSQVYTLYNVMIACLLDYNQILLEILCFIQSDLTLDSFVQSAAESTQLDESLMSQLIAQKAYKIVAKLTKVSGRKEIDGPVHKLVCYVMNKILHARVSLASEAESTGEYLDQNIISEIAAARQQCSLPSPYYEPGSGIMRDPAGDAVRFLEGIMASHMVELPALSQSSSASSSAAVDSAAKAKQIQPGTDPDASEPWIVVPESKSDTKIRPKKQATATSTRSQTEGAQESNEPIAKIELHPQFKRLAGWFLRCNTFCEYMSKGQHMGLIDQFVRNLIQNFLRIFTEEQSDDTMVLWENMHYKQYGNQAVYSMLEDALTKAEYVGPFRSPDKELTLDTFELYLGEVYTICRAMMVCALHCKQILSESNLEIRTKIMEEIQKCSLPSPYLEPESGIMRDLAGDAARCLAGIMAESAGGELPTPLQSSSGPSTGDPKQKEPVNDSDSGEPCIVAPESSRKTKAKKQAKAPYTTSQAKDAQSSNTQLAVVTHPAFERLADWFRGYTLFCQAIGAHTPPRPDAIEVSFNQLIRNFLTIFTDKKDDDIEALWENMSYKEYGDQPVYAKLRNALTQAKYACPFGDVDKVMDFKLYLGEVYTICRAMMACALNYNQILVEILDQIALDKQWQCFGKKIYETDSGEETQAVLKIYDLMQNKASEITSKLKRVGINKDIYEPIKRLVLNVLDAIFDSIKNYPGHVKLKGAGLRIMPAIASQRISIRLPSPYLEPLSEIRRDPTNYAIDYLRQTIKPEIPSQSSSASSSSTPVDSAGKVKQAGPVTCADPSEQQIPVREGDSPTASTTEGNSSNASASHVDDSSASLQQNIGKSPTNKGRPEKKGCKPQPQTEEVTEKNPEQIIEVLRKQLDGFKESNQDLERRLKDAEKELGRVIGAADKEQQLAKDQIAGAQDKVVAFQLQIEQLQQENGQKQKTIDDLRKLKVPPQARSLGKEQKRLGDQNRQEEQSRQAALQGEIQKLIQNNGDLRNQNQHLKQQIAANEATILSANRSLAEAGAKSDVQIAKLIGEIEVRENQIARLSAQIVDHENELAMQKAEIGKLQEQIALNPYQGSDQSQISANHDLLNKIKELKEQIRIMKRVIADYISTIATQAAQIELSHQPQPTASQSDAPTNTINSEIMRNMKAFMHGEFEGVITILKQALNSISTETDKACEVLQDLNWYIEHQLNDLVIRIGETDTQQNTDACEYKRYANSVVHLYCECYARSLQQIDDLMKRGLYSDAISAMNALIQTTISYQRSCFEYLNQYVIP